MTIYIVLMSIIKLEMISSIWRKNAIPFLYKGLKHLQIFVSEGDPGLSPLQKLRDNHKKHVL